MSSGYRCAVLALILTAPLVPALQARGQSQTSVRVHISNFGQTDENHYRGSQPDASNFAELKKIGIRTVIDLQEDGNRKEPTWAHDAGIQYFNIPLSSTRPATAEQTAYFLKLVNDPQNLPVYVHCAGGRHRTGEMTAIYRITHDSWTADQAYDEMLQYDYYAWGGHRSLKDYVYQFYQDQVSGRNTNK